MSGHFYVQDTDTTRRTLLEQGISPKVKMKREIRSLTIGKCTVHTAPENLESIQRFRPNLAQLGAKLEYHGEGLPAISNKALTQLLKASKKRKILEEDEKVQLMKQQDWKCGICGDKLSARTIEFDHIHPLCATFGDQKFQAFHPHCHSCKSAVEERPLHDDGPLTGQVSLAVWKNFIESPLIPALTFCQKEIQDPHCALILDVKRSESEH